MSPKTLLEIHEDVPANHYDEGIRKNLFQRFWHNRRFSEVLKTVESVSGPVLDIGCHSGTFTEKFLPKLGTKEIFGVDISPKAIELAQKRIPYGHFKVADADNLPFNDNFFDVIFCLEVLEHVDDPLEVLKEIHRVLKKGGYGILLVPTDNKLFRIIWFLWTLYYPVWRHAHVQSYKNNNLEKMIQNQGLKISQVRTFNWNMLKLIVFKK